MIRERPFLDPRGSIDRMEFIGGPFDGDHVVSPDIQFAIDRTPNDVLRDILGLSSQYFSSTFNGEYRFADRLEWSFVWVPLVEEHRQ